MPHRLPVYQPKYVAQFQCIGSACEDTCCDGMGVVLDKVTYEKYQGCTDPKMRPLIELNVVPNGSHRTDIHYGMIRPSQGSSCPFLNGTRLCSIQENLGESYLSRTCAVYPRALTTVDGIVERSLYLSCPEAARLILLHPDPIQFESGTLESDPRLHGFPLLDTSHPGDTDKPYHAFHAVRTFVFALLQNRTYRLWERLVILGMFCEQLSQITAQDEPSRTHSLIASFNEYVRDGLFGPTLDNITIQPMAQLNFLLNALEYRVHSEPVGERFLECYREFLQGVGVTADASMEEIGRRYVEAHLPYSAFMDTHEYLLENYIVSTAFRTLFPLGPAQASYETPGVYDAYLLMTIQYVLVRSLLIGLAGHHGASFSQDHCVKLVQSFAKAIEHNPPYLKKLVQTLRENEMTDLALLAVLIKTPARAIVPMAPALPPGARVVLKASARSKKATPASKPRIAVPLVRTRSHIRAVPRV